MTAVKPAFKNDWEQAIYRFLRENPGWLAAHPDLYQSLSPPVRVHGDHMADHMAAMLRQERLQAQAMRKETKTILLAGRAQASLLTRVQEAVLAVMSASDPMELIQGELPHLLGADAAFLCYASGALNSAYAQLDAPLGQHEVLFRVAPGNVAALYAEAAPLARHDALVRVTGIGILAIASRYPMNTSKALAQSTLGFLGRALSIALSR